MRRSITLSTFTHDMPRTVESLQPRLARTSLIEVCVWRSCMQAALAVSHCGRLLTPQEETQTQTACLRQPRKLRACGSLRFSRSGGSVTHGRKPRCKLSVVIRFRGPKALNDRHGTAGLYRRSPPRARKGFPRPESDADINPGACATPRIPRHGAPASLAPGL